MIQPYGNWSIAFMRLTLTFFYIFFFPSLPRNVDKVTSCYKIFFMAKNSGGQSVYTSQFNSDLSQWNLKCTSSFGMNYMFQAAVLFNSDLSKWVRIFFLFF